MGFTAIRLLRIVCSFAGAKGKRAATKGQFRAPHQCFASFETASQKCAGVEHQNGAAAMLSPPPCYNRRVILRRTILAAFSILPLPVAAMAYADLTYADGALSWPGGSARAACGKGGVRADKREGDHASPAGTFPLVSAFYRPDRLAAPPTALPLTALKASDGWV